MIRGITHVRLGLDGRLSRVRWQEVAGADVPTGSAREASIEDIAAAIEAGEPVQFWPRLGTGQRVHGGELRVERDAAGRPGLVEERAEGGHRLLDLPRF